jgi:hypothetical protein
MIYDGRGLYARTKPSATLMRLASLLCCLFAVAGCGEEKTAPVSGSVRLDGQPIVEGAIQFIPIDGTTGPSTGGTISNGHYNIPRAKGAAIGHNRVELRAFKKSNRKIQDPTQPAGATTEEWVPAIPPEYNSSSKLVREIKRGDNVLDFDINVGGAVK